MPKYLGVLTIVLLLGMVLTRIAVLRRQGIKAMKFGKIDKTDFLIPAICPVLFLCPVRRGILLAYCDDEPVFPFRNNLVDGSAVLPGGAFAGLVESDFLSAELSSRH